MLERITSNRVNFVQVCAKFMMFLRITTTIYLQNVLLTPCGPVLLQIVLYSFLLVDLKQPYDKTCVSQLYKTYLYSPTSYAE